MTRCEQHFHGNVAEPDLIMFFEKCDRGGGRIVRDAIHAGHRRARLKHRYFTGMDLKTELIFRCHKCIAEDMVDVAMRVDDPKKTGEMVKEISKNQIPVNDSLGG